MIREFWYDYGEGILTTTLIIFILAAAAWGIAAAEKEACAIKTAGMGYASEWSVLGDCRIQMPDGTWIPLDNFYIQMLQNSGKEMIK